MASDRFSTKHAGPGRVTVGGSFVGGTETATKATGVGYSVAWVSTGRYRITFDDKFYALESFSYSLQASTPANVKSYVLVHTGLASNRTIDVYAYESGTLTDFAALEWVHFHATLKNTSVED